MIDKSTEQFLEVIRNVRNLNTDKFITIKRITYIGFAISFLLIIPGLFGILNIYTEIEIVLLILGISLLIFYLYFFLIGPQPLMPTGWWKTVLIMCAEKHLFQPW